MNIGTKIPAPVGAGIFVHKKIGKNPINCKSCIDIKKIL